MVRKRPTDRIATWNEAFGWDDSSRRTGSTASALIEVALMGEEVWL